MCLCGFVCMRVCVHRDQTDYRLLDPFLLGSQVTVSHLMCGLGSELQSSRRAVSRLK